MAGKSYEDQDHSCVVPSRVTQFGSLPAKAKVPLCLAPKDLSPGISPLWALTPMCTPAFVTAINSQTRSILPAVSAEELQKTMKTLSDQKANEMAPFLSLAMSRAEINTPLRKAAFIAQVAVETDSLTSLVERGTEEYFTRMYEDNTNLGNTEPGDGPLFKGRGFLHLTGRWNYTAAGKALNLKLIDDPDVVETDLTVAAQTSAWYWRFRKGNAAADSGSIKKVTVMVNGGVNGLERRVEFYEKAKVVFGVVPAKPAVKAKAKTK
jgi:predicted chitinase